MTALDVASLLQDLAAGTAGVYAGAMLTEGFVMVPYWRSLAAPSFFDWYAANDRRLIGFFGPVTTFTLGIAVAAAVVSWWAGDDGRWCSAATALLLIAAAAMFPLFFQKPNEAFAAASIAAGDLSEALRRWDFWHRVRIVVVMAALAFALAA
jgi:uncharacterized membrane protein